ncbi:MAG TPA: PspC domain-containing protein [Actinomycetota bacterium]
MSTVSTDQNPPSGPSGPPPARRLTRRANHRVFAGVAGGLADYFAIDPVIIRIAFVVLAITGGAGLLLYLLGWFLIPREDLPSSPGERVFRRVADGPAWLAAALVVIGILVLVSHGNFWAPSIVWGLALIALGIILYTRDGERAAPAAPVDPAAAVATAGAPVASEPWTSPPPASPGTGDQAATAVTEPVGFAPISPAPVAPSLPVVAAPRAPRERSGMGWFVVGAALAALGVAALLNQSGAISLTFGQYFALALAVLGIGLFVSAWVGRARWLIFPCLLLVPFVLATSLIDVPVRGGFGGRVVTPISATQVAGEYRMVAGKLTIDLSRVDFARGPSTVRATVVAGQLRVLVPRGVPVVVTGSVGAGSANVFGNVVSGLQVPIRGFGAGAPWAGPVTLDLRVSFGAIQVSRIDAAAIVPPASATPTPPAVPSSGSQSG